MRLVVMMMMMTMMTIMMMMVLKVGGTDCIIVVGTTGLGKSTCINLYTGQVCVIMFHMYDDYGDDDDGDDNVDEESLPQNLATGDSAQSVTSEIVTVTDEIHGAKAPVWVDTPGECHHHHHHRHRRHHHHHRRRRRLDHEKNRLGRQRRSVRPEHLQRDAPPPSKEPIEEGQGKICHITREILRFIFVFFKSITMPF